MSIRLTRAFALAAVLSSLAGAAYAADSTDPVVAKVNGKDILLSNLKALQQIDPQLRQAPLEAIYDQILALAINNELILEQAKKDKLENDAKVKALFTEAQNEILMDAWVRKKVNTDVTEATIKARLDEIVKAWTPYEQVRASHIVVETEDAAKAVIADLKSGVKFEDEVKAKDGSKKIGGDIGYFGKNESGVPPEFAEAAFKLKVGEYSQVPVQTQYGWHVILVEDRRMAPPPTLEEAKGKIGNQLAHEDMKKVVDDLQRAAQVKRFKIDGTPADAPVKP